MGCGEVTPRLYKVDTELYQGDAEEKGFRD